MISAQPLWAGRTVALLGIVLLALNLRTAVTALSPIASYIRQDIALDQVAFGVLGMLPPIAFAVSGIVAPWVVRRVGLERSLVIACLAMIIGPVIRACAGNYGVLLGGTVILLAGTGFGNVLLPPAVKKYFPDRIGQLTAIYATLLAISASIPPYFAVPLAGAVGWRASLAGWCILALAGLSPWLIAAIRTARQSRRDREAGLVAETAPKFIGQIRHSRVAWAITLAFAVSGLSAYTSFAWLPQMVIDLAGVSDIQAGQLLALSAVVSLPTSLLVPLIAARMRSVSPIIYLSVVLMVGGYLGLLTAPTVFTWLWVVLLGIASMLFPLCLALINLRTRSSETSVALSGFVHGVGYAASACGPLVVAVLHEITDGWTVPLLFLLGVSVVAIASGFILAKPRFVEDDLVRS